MMPIWSSYIKLNLPILYHYVKLVNKLKRQNCFPANINFVMNVQKCNVGEIYSLIKKAIDKKSLKVIKCVCKLTIKKEEFCLKYPLFKAEYLNLEKIGADKWNLNLIYNWIHYEFNIEPFHAWFFAQWNGSSDIYTYTIYI